MLIHCYTCAMHWWDGMLPAARATTTAWSASTCSATAARRSPPTATRSRTRPRWSPRRWTSSASSDATVVGHSLGSRSRPRSPSRAPGWSRRLVNIDQAPDNELRRATLPRQARLRAADRAGDLPGRRRTSAVRDALKVAFAPGYNLAQGFENPDQPVDSYRAMTYSSYKKTASDEDDFVDEKPLDERLAALPTPMPLLVIFGTEDQVCDPESSADAYRDMPGASGLDGRGLRPLPERREAPGDLRPGPRVRRQPRRRGRSGQARVQARRTRASSKRTEQQKKRAAN